MEGNIACLAICLVQVVLLLSSHNAQGSKSGSGHGHCANIYSNKNFRGSRLTLLDGKGWSYTGNSKIIPKSVKVTQNCSLTLFDGKGNIQALQSDVQNLTWVSKHPIHSTCCHCGTCDKEETQCAKLYQYNNCNSCGAPIELSPEEEIRDFKLVRNKVGSVAVRTGCKLYAYYEVKTVTWILLAKVNLRSGNNFLDAHNVFNEEADVRIERAVCNCNLSSFAKVDSAEAVELFSPLSNRISHNAKNLAIKVQNPDSSKESSSVSGSSESWYRDQDPNDEYQWFYR